MTLNGGMYAKILKRAFFEWWHCAFLNLLVAFVVGVEKMIILVEFGLFAAIGSGDITLVERSAQWQILENLRS